MGLIPMWVNQPSTLQPDHALHGTNVLMEEEDGICAYIWYVKDGVFESIRIEKRSLSKGQLPPTTSQDRTPWPVDGTLAQTTGSIRRFRR